MSWKPGNACTVATSVANAASSEAGMPKRSMPTTSKASAVILTLHWRLGSSSLQPHKTVPLVFATRRGFTQ